VIPTARKDADLERLRQAGFTPLRFDAADSASVQSAAAKALELVDGHLGGVVNNAGFGQAGAVEDLSREAIRYQFEVNLFGMQELTNLLIPVFRTQGCGRIVNVSSMLGRLSLPFFGSYSATKHAMTGLSNALRVELAGTGIAVSLIEPGPIATRFGENAADHAERMGELASSRFAPLYLSMLEQRRKGRRGGLNDLFRHPPESVARQIAHALESTHPRRRYCVTIPAHLGAIASRLAPEFMIEWVLERNWRNRLMRAVRKNGSNE